LNAAGVSCLGGLNVKLAVFVGAELAPNVPLPNVLLLLCGVLELLPNVKSGFAVDAAGLTFAEKLNPLLVDCCDEAEPNVNKEEFDVALVSLGLVVENIVDVVVAPPKADVVLFPKAGALVDPKGDEVALFDGVPNVERVFAAGELNTGNFVSGVPPKIGGLLSLPPNVGTLVSGIANPDGLLPVVVNDDGLSVPNAIVVFDSLLNNGVELETIGKSVVTGVLLAALLVDEVVSVALFPPNDTLVDNAADDVGT